MLELLADLNPVGKVVAHMVAAEGEHGEGVMAELAELGALGGGGGLGGEGSADQDAMVPGKGLRDEGDGRYALTAKENG